MRLTLPALLFATIFGATAAHAQVPYIKTISGNGTGGFGGDGLYCTSGVLNAPRDVKVDGVGNIYVLDYLNYRVRKIQTNGLIVTIAGTGVLGSSGDGSLGTSANILPYGIALDKSNNLYISDAAIGTIRKVNATTGIISTIAGTGIQGNTGNGGLATAARLKAVFGMAFDTSDNMYVADGMNHVVRRIDKTTGIITRFAGTDTKGNTGDGDFAVLAELDSPYAVATDRKGNVYISDLAANVVRKVDAAGMISTFAGTGAYGYSGDGGAAVLATFNRPSGLTVDSRGNVYIADADNNVIRKVDTDGVITTVIGNGTAGFGGDLGPVNGCNLLTPFGIALAANGDMYIADANNQRVRQTYTPVAVGATPEKTTVAVYPNPAETETYISGLTKGDKLQLADMTGKVVYSSVATAEVMPVSMAGMSAGIYVLQVTSVNGGNSVVVKVVKQ